MDKYKVLIIGSDANAYYLARCYYELFHKKVDVLAKSMLPYTRYSNILNIYYDDRIWDNDGFIDAIYKYKSRYPSYKILLISSNEAYAKIISINKKKLLKDNFVFSYPDIKLMESLIDKETFYKTYSNSCIDLPKTYYYDCSSDIEFNDDIDYPIIVKPSNVIMYNHISFDGKNKIFLLDNKEELDMILRKIKDNGYTDTLIIQEYIPGDDSHLFDAVAYSDSTKKCKMMSFAQIGLQEHSKNMVGNAAVLINGYNQFGNTEEITSKLREFLDTIGYQGFCEFDLKYDERDGKFKVLEINARQGRSSYYVTSLGYNLVGTLIDDLIYGREMEYKLLTDQVLLSFVSKSIIKKYIKNDEYRKYALSIYKNGVVNPVRYKEDRNLFRKLFYVKKNMKYMRDYKNSYWREV